MIEVIRYDCLSPDLNRVLRYMGSRGEASGELKELAQWAAAEVKAVCRCSAAVLRTTVAQRESGLCLQDCFETDSAALKKNLHGCREAFVLCATVGAQVDRLIAMQKNRPAAAAACDAAATAAIEQWCDLLCGKLQERVPGQYLRPRFSPGYGDLPLGLQSRLTQVLQADRLLGVCLTEALLLTPTKSVTAVVGIADEKPVCAGECDRCQRKECPYRA